jgi:hypothetical protein
VVERSLKGALSLVIRYAYYTFSVLYLLLACLVDRRKMKGKRPVRFDL